MFFFSFLGREDRTNNFSKMTELIGVFRINVMVLFFSYAGKLFVIDFYFESFFFILKVNGTIGRNKICINENSEECFDSLSFN